jgi:16S rRNA (guanine527-N7)-methyltransferase
MKRAPASDLVQSADALVELASASGIAIDTATIEALVGYATLLLAWNTRINLTAARTPAKLVTEQFPDSFFLARALPEAATVVDVGSGGGLPAIPLALLRPRLRLTLVEPIAKKAAFLRTAARELGLGERLVVDGRRAEALVADALLFDVAVSRATLPPPRWAALGSRLVRPGGLVFVLTTAEAALDVPPGLELVTSQVYFGGKRRLVELRRST